MLMITENTGFLSKEKLAHVKLSMPVLFTVMLIDKPLWARKRYWSYRKLATTGLSKPDLLVYDLSLGRVCV